MKKCPIFVTHVLLDPGKMELAVMDCLKGECAWWDEVEGGRCAIISLVGSLDDIATKLMHIDDNTTKERKALANLIMRRKVDG